jgi:hypothetical protein
LILNPALFLGLLQLINNESIQHRVTSCWDPTWKLGRAKKLVERLHYENLVVLMRDWIFKKQSVHTWQNFDNHSLSNDKQLGVFRQRECLKSLFIMEADAHYESKEKKKVE